ncbi:MAG: glycosyltransferase [Flavobacteriales bacterium]|nr:glycosyltransferase [Flavobacteriales bacterium]MCB9166695.1 glycosyltransferase [Flavobacteriales bacterium]
MKDLEHARILVAPLDWGLGHATRCIPVVRALLRRGAVPVIGADAGPLALLRSEFPDLEHVRIPGLHIRYARGPSQLWSMVKQFPAMWRTMHEERQLFDRIAGSLKLDAVISDQRFGIRSDEVPSVLITHQVFPFTPTAQAALRRLNLHLISRFDACWIMDHAEPPGLAGELSHGAQLPANARYIGPRSRFKAQAIDPEEEPYAIVAVISGPEPQRSLLEELLKEQMQRIPGPHLLVRGLPEQQGSERAGQVRMVPHLGGEELARVLRRARMIVSRTGYTTLMDLDALGRTALVIPTPGQEEQEYLGRLHAKTGRFLVQHQDRIDVSAAWIKLYNAPRCPTAEGEELLESALDDLTACLVR